MRANTSESVELTCPQGHRWRLSTSDISAGDIADRTRDTVPCPLCRTATTLRPLELDIAPRTTSSRPAIPGFELLEEIGRGGMGVVYKARQERPTRTVAIKVMNRLPAHRGSLAARFRAEAEAVAQLEHPDIVRVYATGDTDEVSYLVLEYVAGGSLADRLRGEPLPPDEAARITARLARAVHFAHQHSILHRDLKPANVLVTADGSMKLTDFGLAKRLDADTADTRTGEVLGTVAYMAPEQATGMTRHLSPACDVHALGVMLYEMLTGCLPFRGEGVVEILTLVATADAVPPRRLQPSIACDLETICLKCLEKSPRQRYGSAAALADDLERLLNHEPIHARPAGWLEKTAKWSRRRPATAFALFVSFLLPLLIAAGVIWHNLGLRRQMALTEQQYARAEFNLARTQDQLDELLDEISSGELAALPESSAVRASILHWAQQLCQQLVTQNPEHPLLRLQSARAQRQAADIQRMLGQDETAERSYEAAVAELQALVHRFGDEPAYLRELASALNNRSLARGDGSGSQRAIDDLRDALQIWEQLQQEKGRELKDTARYAASLSNLGLALQQLGKFEAADDCFRKALVLRQQVQEQSPSSAEAAVALAISRVNRGSLLHAAGELDPSQKLFESAIDDLSRLPADSIVRPDVRQARATAHNNLAAVLTARRQYESARDAYQTTLRLYQELVDEYPLLSGYRQQLGTAQLNYALLLAAEHQQLAARELLAQTREMFESLADQQPRTVAARDGIARAIEQLAVLEQKNGAQQEAEQLLLRALQLREELVDEFPQHADVHSQLGQLHHTAANFLAARSEWRDARQHFEQAIAGQRAALNRSADHFTYRLRLRDHYLALVELLIAQGEVADAVTATDQMSALFPDGREELIRAADVMARCIPLAATIKGAPKIEGQAIDRYCKNRCLELLEQAAEQGADVQQLLRSPRFEALEGDKAGPEDGGRKTGARRRGSEDGVGRRGS